MKKILNFLLVFGLAAFAAQTGLAQDEVPPPMPSTASLSDQQLDQLLGPIALYPDPLLAIMLPAATFPTEIVEADRYISTGGDPSQIEQQPWDPTVQALAHYPDVLKWMDDNLNWTAQVGQAFQNQPQDVMDSIQRLRMEAYNMGNLQSTPQQQVIDDNGNIEILPASDSDDMYVPQYQPDEVYYEAPNGLPYITFTAGYVIGPWLWCDFDWHHHHLVYWNQNNPRPANWWRESSAQRSAYFAAGHTTVWSPSARPAYAGGFQGDRGWNNTAARGWSMPTVSRPAPTLSGHPMPTLSGHPQPTLSGHPQPTLGQNYAPAQNYQNWNAPVVNRPAPAPDYQRPQNNAFIGIQSAQDTRDYSQRGQDSMQSGGYSRPAPAPAPSGGGGFHGGGSFGGGGGGRR